MALVYHGAVNAGAEKRQHHRFLAKLDVRVISGERIPQDLKLSTLDIGVGGSRCIANLRLPPEARLHLTFTLVGGELRAPTAINVDAVVLRCNERQGPHHGFPFETALQFVRIDAREKRVLQTYLNSL